MEDPTGAVRSLENYEVGNIDVKVRVHHPPLDKIWKFEILVVSL